MFLEAREIHTMSNRLLNASLGSKPIELCGQRTPQAAIKMSAPSMVFVPLTSVEERGFELALI